MRHLFLFFALALCWGCSDSVYRLDNQENTNKLMLWKGHWLMGDIKADSEYKDKLTRLVRREFSKHIGDRLHYPENDPSLLLLPKTPLHPTWKQIRDLKTGTGYEYYINIKFSNSRDEAHGRSYAEVTVEIYDLNRLEVVYTQTVNGGIGEQISLSLQPRYKIIESCFMKIMDDIEKKAVPLD